MIDEIDNTLQGAFDAPSSNDFQADHLLGLGDVELPTSIDLNTTPSHDQARTRHCTSYGLTHIEEILNTLEHGHRITLDPEEQWNNQKENRGNPPYMEKEGDSLQNALNTFIKKGLVNKNNQETQVAVFMATGYAAIKKDVDTFKKSLVYAMPIYTGWKDHCFAIVGYRNDDQVFIAKNSFGPQWGKKGNGTFEISFNDISKLFTPYVIYDKKDLVHIYRDVTTASPYAAEIAWALQQGLMNGYGTAEDPTQRFFKPEQPITRAEFATVLQRLVQKYNLK